MLAVLLQIDGWDPVAAAPVVLRAASHDDVALCGFAGVTWWPAIAKLPTLRYDLFDGDFGGQISAPGSTLTLQAEPWPDFGRYMLADARLQLWTGELGADWPSYTLRFDGRVSSQPALAEGQASIDFAVDDRWLDAALLATYAGTTGAEGPAALKGQAKPLALGAPRYAAGTLVDSITSTFQLSAYGPVVGVDVALEKLARFGAPIADYPDYASLVAANVPAGTWATSNAGGWARLGAPPVGQVSFLVRGDNVGGWARKPGQIVTRLAAIVGAADRVDAGSAAALDVARPYPLSLDLTEQGTARDLVQKIAASVNAVAGVSWTGKLFTLPVTLGAPTITLAADGSALPPVASVKQIENAAPWQKLAIGAERAWTVHALADIAFTATLVDMGAYTAGNTYREGNIVQSAGSSWLYINPVPTAGNAPPALPATATAFWRVLAKAGSDGKDGSDGAAGASPLSMSVSVPTIVIAANADLTTKAGQLPRNFAVTVLSGTVDVTAECSLVATPNTNAIAVASTGAGSWQVTQADAQGTIAITGTYGQTNIPATSIAVTRQADPPPPASASSIAGAIGADVTGTTLVVITSPVTLRANGSGQLGCSGGANYSINSAPTIPRTFTAGLAFAWRVTGASDWSFTGQATGSQASQPKTGVDQDPVEGSVSLSTTLSGLTSGTAYDVAIAARQASGSASTSVHLTGSFVVSQ